LANEESESRWDGAYKMQKFTTVELKQSISNAIKPETVIVLNIDGLLLLSLMSWVDLIAVYLMAV